MSEAEILEILVELRTSQIDALAILVTLNFAMIGAIYYFLGHCRILLKSLAFIAYTLGVVLLAGTIRLHAQTYAALRDDLERIGAESLAALAVLAQRSSEVTLAVDAALVGSAVLLWLGVAYLLFVARPVIP